MRVNLEFFGISRLVTGAKSLTLEMEEQTTFRDLLRLLARRYPGMVGDVIHPDGTTLQHPNIFNLNARQMIREERMDESLNDGDRVILMSMSAGG